MVETTKKKKEKKKKKERKKGRVNKNQPEMKMKGEQSTYHRLMSNYKES